MNTDYQDNDTKETKYQRRSVKIRVRIHFTGAEYSAMELCVKVAM